MKPRTVVLSSHPPAPAEGSGRRVPLHTSNRIYRSVMYRFVLTERLTDQNRTRNVRLVTEVSTPLQSGPTSTSAEDRCQFPGGCSNVIEYAGTGRRPKYCYQVVAGLLHDRGNAKKVLDGSTLPARRRGDSGNSEQSETRPVTRAQHTVQTQVAGLAARLDEAAGELRDALEQLADSDAVAAEIAAARRAARAEVDQAQAAADDAHARARLAEADAAEARRSAVDSDQEAETAGDARRAAEESLAHAEAQRDELAGQLNATRAELEATQQALDEAHAERDQLQRDLDTAHTELTATGHDRDEARGDRDRMRGELAELAHALEQVQADRDTTRARADQLQTERDTAVADTAAARRDVERLEVERDRAIVERDARTDERDTAHDQATDARTRLAVAESTIAALHEQLDRDLTRERSYGQQRLDDAEARHQARERELRDELARLRAQQTPSGHDTDADDAPPPARPAHGGRSKASTSAPRPARRRRGAEKAPGDSTNEPEGSS